MTEKTFRQRRIISFRCSDQLSDIIQNECDRCSTSLSEFIRSALVAAMDRRRWIV